MDRTRAEHILQLSPPWTRKDVRKAYKQRAKELHPDKHPDRKDMATKFVELKEAHDYLLGWEHTCDENRNTETTILEELLTKIADSYQEALVPFIQSLPLEKQTWIIEFLEMYGEVLLGEDVFSLLSQLRIEQESILKTNKEIKSDSLYHVHFDELLTDKIIVHDINGMKTFIPSWCTEWNTYPIIRKLPKNITMDSSNNIFFHISISFRTIYSSQQEIFHLNMSYFSDEKLIHVFGHVPRNTIRITKEAQQIQEAEIQCIRIYDKQGTVIAEKKEGVFLPDEPLDTPQKRSSCYWLLSLIP